MANIKPNIPGFVSPNAFRCELPLIRCRPMSLGLRHHLHCLNWRAVMNLQTLSWRALRVKATRPQWRYALRNGIAMCLALSIAYALDLDEPYWAMTSAAVVSFPTVGGVISKSFGRIAGSLLGACAACCLPVIHSTIRLFLFSISGWLALCTGLRPVHQQRRLCLSAGGLYLRHHRLSGD